MVQKITNQTHANIIMKRSILTLICIAVAYVASAQDRIVFKNSEEINVKITDISPETVTYKLWNNLEGTNYIVNKSEILFISYQNGDKDVFNTEQDKPTATTNPLNIRLQGYGNVGLICLPYGPAVGPTLDLTIGALFGDYFYAGFETGFHSLIEDPYYEGYIPLAVNLRGYLTKTKLRPFVNVSLGGFIGVAGLGGFNGFYCQTGAGVDIQRFSVGLGYSGLVKFGTASSIYFKLGIRFGGKKH